MWAILVFSVLFYELFKAIKAINISTNAYDGRLSLD